MNKDNRTIEKLFDSARNYKAPISDDDVRSLIEIADISPKKNGLRLTKFGVKIMTILSAVTATLIIASLISNPTSENLVQEKNVKSSVQAIENKDIASAKQNESLSNPKAEKSETSTISSAERKVSNKVQGLNRLILSEQELADFGIILLDNENPIDNKQTPSIGFSYKISEKAIMNMRFYKKSGSTHSISENTNVNNAMIKISPTIITNFNGEKRTVTQIMDTDINEFIPFQNELIDFLGLELDADYPINTLPKNIFDQIDDLSVKFSHFNIQSPDMIIGEMIKSDFSKINDQLRKLNREYRQSMNKVDLESNDMPTQVVYVEDLNDKSLDKYREDMLAMGVRIVCEKHPIYLKNILEKNNKEFVDNINEIGNAIQDHIMFSKMIAIEIPYKNDPEGDGLIFWYAPSEEVINALPERVRSGLLKEFTILQRSGAICGAPIEAEKAFMDIWRSCDGAIENLRLFPNPVQDLVNIKFDLKSERKVKISIHDLNGVEIKTILDYSEAIDGKFSERLDLTSLKPGMYMLVVSTPNGENAVQRLIRQ